MRVFFTICQNGLLGGSYNTIYRLPFTYRDLIERCVTTLTRIADMQRAIEVVFGNMVDMGDHRNGHPGVNSFHISCLESSLLLLEISHCLKGIYSSKG